MFRTIFGRRILQIIDNQLTSIKRLVQTDVETDAERKLAETLSSKIDSNSIRVKDISGGCGAMYEIFIESEIFRGKRKVQQHRIVNEALAEEVKAMHGLRIHTVVPTSS